MAVGPSPLLILLCGAYLAARRFMDWRIPLAMLGSAALTAWLLFAFDPVRYPNPFFMLFSGGLILGAVYMATDMATSPVTPKGMWVYGALIGLLTVVIRYYSGLPEGVMYAILIANAASPLIEKITQPMPFGRGVLDRAQEARHLSAEPGLHLARGSRRGDAEEALPAEEAEKMTHTFSHEHAEGTKADFHRPSWPVHEPPTRLPPTAGVADRRDDPHPRPGLGHLRPDHRRRLPGHLRCGRGEQAHRHRARGVQGDSGGEVDRRVSWRCRVAASRKVGAGDTANAPGAVKFFAAYDAAGKLAGIAAEGGAKGYADTVRIMFGYSPDCQCVVGIGVVSMRETPGIGDKIITDKDFLANFNALDVKLEGRTFGAGQRGQGGQARRQDQSVADRRHRRRDDHLARGGQGHQRFGAGAAAAAGAQPRQAGDEIMNTAQRQRTWDEFTEGIWRQNPVFVMVLGMCPTLAVTVSAVNALSMGLATTVRAGLLLRPGVADAQHRSRRRCASPSTSSSSPPSSRWSITPSRPSAWRSTMRSAPSSS